MLVALALIVLVGAAGLGLDGANAFNQRRNAQNAADAAAMAGANALIGQQRQDPLNANGELTVYNEVADYLDQHGIDPDAASTTWTAYYVDGLGNRGSALDTSGSVSTSAKGVEVDVRFSFSTYFMQVAGQSSLNASSAATAIFGKHKVDGGDILPITLSQQAAEDMQDDEGDSFVFNGDSSNAIAPGNFGAISLDPDEDLPNSVGNNSDCTGPSGNPDNPSYWWCNGTQHDIEIGDWLYGDPGEVAASLEDEIQWRIDHRPYGLIPIYDTSNQLNGNNAQFRIVGFLVVELQDQDLRGNPKTITARYKDYVVSTGAIDPNAPVEGLYAINLIK